MKAAAHVLGHVFVYGMVLLVGWGFGYLYGIEETSVHMDACVALLEDATGSVWEANRLIDEFWAQWPSHASVPVPVEAEGP